MGRGEGAGRAVQYNTIKVRLYPTPEQALLFEKTFGCCRYIWNRMLADEKRFYLETDTHFIPTPAKYKREAPFLKEVDNQALIQEHGRLTRAFRQFFKSPDTFGYPHFKRKKADRDSFTACNHEFTSGPTIYLTRDGIRMTKAGVVRAKFHRRPRSGWKLKRITVSRTPTGRYDCSILFACPVRTPQAVAPDPARTVGLKYSAAHFYVDDTGHMADPPHWLRRSQDKLAAIQRRLSRMTPGSQNYAAQVQKYRLLHEHIANQRRDFLHKESRRIANAWDAVCMQKNAMQAVDRFMQRANGLEAGFGTFRVLLDYKLARQGKQLLLVDRFEPVARQCSRCGYLLPEGVDYGRRVWRCPACGAQHRREVNAAHNIKQAGLRALAG